MGTTAAALFFTCLVVGVTDGDTLTARCDVEDAKQTIIVRLSQIDAPEKRQPWGERGRQHLAELCFKKPKKPATVREEARDRNRRMVARVTCDGIDASEEQVRSGLAWVFDRYVTDRAVKSAGRSDGPAVPAATWWLHGGSGKRNGLEAEASNPLI